MALEPALHDQLTRRERDIINALFALGNRASVDEIRARLADPPSYSAVRTMVGRLEDKGYVRHSRDGVRYLYSATTSPARAMRGAIAQCVRVFFGGSRIEMLSTMLRQERWTPQELDALQRQIDAARQAAEER